MFVSWLKTTATKPKLPHLVEGKKPAEMKNKEDYYDVVEIVPGAPLMQKPDAFGCNLGDYT